MIQKSSTLRTAELFFRQPASEHYLMDISRTLRVAHTSIKKNLKSLQKSGIILTSLQKRGKRFFPAYRANIGTKTFRRHKQLYNLSSLYESGLIEFIEDHLYPKSMVLFGSYARGEDTEQSDIDLYLECKEQPIALAPYEKTLSRKIELHFKDPFSSYPKELKNNIINGIVLSGFLEGYQ